MPITVAAYDEVILGGTAFKCVNSQVNVQELGTFERKITIGDYTKDSQNLLSTWIISDLSGGHGISDHITDATVNRYRYATLDVSRPNMWTKRLLVSTETGTAGAFWPLGDLLYSGNVEMYGAFGTDLHIWTESTDTWTDTTSNLAAAPVNNGVAFAGTGTLRLFIPLGATGYDTYTGAAHASVAASGSTPAAKEFVILSKMLVCLDTSNQLWWTTDGTAWTSFGADGKVDTSLTAYRLDTYRDGMDNPTLVISTNGGVWTFDPAGPTLYQQDLQYPMHPDQGLAATVWRGNYYVSVGMGIHDWNSGSGTISAMGLDRDDGLPYLYSFNSKIVDLFGSYNDLYALVQGSTADSIYPSVHRWTGFGWHAVWEASGTATVTRLYVSQARSTYRLWFGGGNNSYTSILPRSYTNPKVLISNSETTDYPLEASPGIPGLYVETGMNDMGMGGYRKIAHSVKVRTGFPETAPYNGIAVYYRTDEESAYTLLHPDGTPYTPAIGSDEYEVFTYWFKSDRTGVAFDEIELKLASQATSAFKYMTMDFIKIPRRNKAWTMTFDLSNSYDDTSPDTMATAIDDLIAADTITTMIHRGTTYYVRVASWSGTDFTGKGDDRGTRTVQILETRYDAIAS